MLIFYQILTDCRRRHLVVVVVVGVSLQFLASWIRRFIVKVSVVGVSMLSLFVVFGRGVLSCGCVCRLLLLVGGGVLLLSAAAAASQYSMKSLVLLGLPCMQPPWSRNTKRIMVLLQYRVYGCYISSCRHPNEN